MTPSVEKRPLPNIDLPQTLIGLTSLASSGILQPSPDRRYTLWVVCPLCIFWYTRRPWTRVLFSPIGHLLYEQCVCLQQLKLNNSLGYIGVSGSFKISAFLIRYHHQDIIAVTKDLISTQAGCAPSENPSISKTCSHVSSNLNLYVHLVEVN